MLSDEEKKAIEIIKFLQEKCLLENGRGMMPIYRIDDLANAIETLLNLIEKQQKEIEELKRYEEGYKLLSYSLDNYTSNDKIKAKIEEYENKIKKIRSKKLINEPEDTIVITRYAHYISVLQSLLEKE